MKIVLAEHFGMCFGVRDAIAQAVDLAEQGPLTILGELVRDSDRTRTASRARRGLGITRSIGSDIRAGDDYRTWNIGRKARSVARTDSTLSMERVLSFGTRMNN